MSRLTLHSHGKNFVEEKERKARHSTINTTRLTQKRQAGASHDRHSVLQQHALSLRVGIPHCLLPCPALRPGVSPSVCVALPDCAFPYWLSSALNHSSAGRHAPASTTSFDFSRLLSYRFRPARPFRHGHEAPDRGGSPPGANTLLRCRTAQGAYLPDHGLQSQPSQAGHS